MLAGVDHGRRRPPQGAGDAGALAGGLRQPPRYRRDHRPRPIGAGVVTAPTYLAVDVGTLTARAGLFDGKGQLLATGTAPLDLQRPEDGQAVYLMDQLWQAVVEAIRRCTAEAPEAARRVAGLAFDATSSVQLEGLAPALGFDVLCWMDHRGEAQARTIDATGHAYLDHLGGSISPEMHLPKLLWVKQAAPEAWAKVTAVRDLSDALAQRATGREAHSLCGLACKWPYLPAAEAPWQHDLLAALGIDDLLQRGVLTEGGRPVGAVHGHLRPDVAKATGLPAGTPVAIGLIDAEAGALGALGAGFRGRMNQRLALIGGTSTSILAFARDARRIPGVWGPFRDAVFAGIWMHEAGLTMAGAALDAILTHHPASPGAASAASHQAVVAAIEAALAAEGPAFAWRRHLVPDWLGNRAPLGAGDVRALATGAGPDTDHRSLLELYYATARALALQTRHILLHLNHHGYALDEVTLAGGHRRNPLLKQLYADALGAALIDVDVDEPVLLGTAMIAAVAAGHHPTTFDALDAMAPTHRPVPRRSAWAEAHDLAYAVYLDLFEARNAADERASALRGMGGR
ncbi:MAG: ribulokinase [Geminicoccaceae bacterium]|nr:MAG: ribulokinase [Geminicoccaceae bacterium]